MNFSVSPWAGEFCQSLGGWKHIQTVEAAQQLKFRLRYQLQETEGLSVPHGWTASWFSHIFPSSVLFPLFFPSAVCSYLFLPHCSLITPLPFSQSFLIRLFKFLKPVSLFHNSWYAILQPLPSPDLIFTGFVPHHNISFCPSYLLSCPSLSLQINLSFFLFHYFSPTFSSFFFYQDEKLMKKFYLLLDEFFPWTREMPPDLYW